MPEDNFDPDELLRRSADVQVPPDVEARMRRRLTEFRARVEQSRARPVVELARSLIHPESFRVPVAAVAVLAAMFVVFFVAGGSDAGRVYAAAATRLRAAHSLRYTIVIAPFVEVEFSYRAPSQQRVRCSWGTEIRADGSGAQLVIIHSVKGYVREKGKPDNVANTADLIQQLKTLPAKADAFLGEQLIGGRKLVGYRVNAEHAGSMGSGFESLDLWLEAGSGNPNHVDITTAEPGKPRYQMHIKDIEVDAEIDPAIFDMSPPKGYAEIAGPRAVITGPGAGQKPREDRTGPAAFRPEIKQLPSETAVVVPMKGSYLQAGAAVDAVASHLRRVAVTPTGPSFGRFASEQHWDAGYPVPPGTPVEPPFELVTLPAGSVLSVVVQGPWGQDSTGRWTRLFTWIIEQGYTPVGPPIEIWSGDEHRPEAQVTEMQIAVTKAP